MNEANDTLKNKKDALIQSLVGAVKSKHRSVNPNAPLLSDEEYIALSGDLGIKTMNVVRTIESDIVGIETKASNAKSLLDTRIYELQSTCK